MALGGIRQGAGRPKGVVPKKVIERRQKEEMMQQRLKELVALEWDDLIHAQIEKAKGIKIEMIDKNGEVYYKDPGPDTAAFKTLIEHSIGKPKETVDVNTTNETLDIVVLRAIDKIYGKDL